MTRHRDKLFGAVLAFALVAAVVPLAASAVGASLAPNYSLLLYRHSGNPIAARLTLNNGKIVEKGTSSLAKTFTSVAISRDTMMLYNKNSGTAVTGTFVNGVFAKKHTYTLSKGFDDVVAGCDTVFLFDVDRQTGVNGTLTGGAYKNRGAFGFAGLDITTLAASCNTILEYSSSTGYGQTEKFHGGQIVSGLTSYSFSANWSSITATDDSALFYDLSGGVGAWGTLNNGLWAQTGSTNTFAPGFTSIGGTPNSLFFYRASDGAVAISTLVGGNYNYVKGFPGIGSWLIVSGGK